MGQITNYYGRCACGISPVAYWASALSRCGTSAAAEDACCGTKIWSRMANQPNGTGYKLFHTAPYQIAAKSGT
ncbi:hypothetical protein VBQ91_08150, partial [Klebsiella pneumoniae]|nr:hypothetical protein [Klebsiella pneumoniae]